MHSGYIIREFCNQQDNVIGFEGNLMQTSEFKGGNVSIVSLNPMFKSPNNA